MDTLSDFPEINYTLCESISLLPCDSTGPYIYSLDSGADSLQELFNSMQDSNSNTNASINDTGITGVMIRPRQPQQTALDNLSSQQGFARRRIRLQCSVQAGTLSSSESESSIVKDDNEDREEIFLVRSNEDREATVKVTEQVYVLMEINYIVQVEENEVHDDIVNGKAMCPQIKLEELSVHGKKFLS